MKVVKVESADREIWLPFHWAFNASEKALIHTTLIHTTWNVQASGAVACLFFSCAK